MWMLLRACDVLLSRKWIERYSSNTHITSIALRLEQMIDSANLAGPRNQWPKWTTGRGCTLSRTSTTPTSGRAEQTCWDQERKCNAARSGKHADEHVAGKRGNGWWRHGGTLIIIVCLIVCLFVHSFVELFGECREQNHTCIWYS